MQIPRIYFNGELGTQKTITLGETASGHLVRVLRCKPGDPLVVFNGKGGEYSARIENIEKKAVSVEIENYSERTTESPLQIHLGQGISRGERMDFVIQKSVELGVHKITPLFTERCGVKISAERLSKRIQHWQSVAISACEQSGRCLVPHIMPPKTPSAWMSEPHETGFVCDTDANQRVKDYPPPVGAVSLLIGSEGGLTPKEIVMAQEENFQPLSLGPRILRTETATVVAIALIQSQWADL